MRQEEIEAHCAAMQRELENKVQQGIDDRLQSDIEAANQKLQEAKKAVKNAAKRAIQAAEEEADQEIGHAQNKARERYIESSYAIQKGILYKIRDHGRLLFLREVFYEAPDVFELTVAKLSRSDGEGGLNAFRLVDQRCKRLVESCTTKLTNLRLNSDSLPRFIQRCRRIEEIRCGGDNLISLEGCPDGLKWLSIHFAPHLTDLSPLASCSVMESLTIAGSSVTDISVVSSMPLLEVFICEKNAGRPWIKDLSPLSSCHRLKNLGLSGNTELKDISPLSECTTLETLDISFCPLITSLAPLSQFILLNSALKNLKTIRCQGIDPQTSLLPLASCPGLVEVLCSPNAIDIEELKKRRPDIKIYTV